MSQGRKPATGTSSPMALEMASQLPAQVPETETGFFTAMGTYLSLRLWYGKPSKGRIASGNAFSAAFEKIPGFLAGARASWAIEKAFKEVNRLEGIFSAFREKSDVARLNRAARFSSTQVPMDSPVRWPGRFPVFMSPETREILQWARLICELSYGAFDVTTGALTSLWRNAIEKKCVPKREDVKAALDKAGLEIDLGGIAKGYAAQRAMQVMARHCGSFEAGIVDFGGNVVLHGSLPEGRPFRVGIQDPDGSRGDILGVLEIPKTPSFISLVTSGDYERSFDASGIRYHHIIDPRTGYPAKSGVRSITCVARVTSGTKDAAPNPVPSGSFPEMVSGALADALSTAMYVLGLKESLSLIERVRARMPLDLQAIFVLDSGKIYITPGLSGMFHPINRTFATVTFS